MSPPPSCCQVGLSKKEAAQPLYQNQTEAVRELWQLPGEDFSLATSAILWYNSLPNMK